MNIKKYVQEILWGFPKFVSLLGLRILWRDAGEQALEVKASGIEARAKFLEFLRSDDVELNGEVSLSWFITVDSGRKLGSDETVNGELNPGEMSSFRGGIFSQVEGFLDKEFSLLFTSELPTLFEPGIFGFPAVEEAIRGKFRVSFKELIDGCGRSTD